MARIHRDRRLRGWGLGAGAVGISVLAALAFFAALAGIDDRSWRRGRGGLEIIAPEPPSPESFDHAPPAIANAMRANVYVAGSAGHAGGLTGLQWCGAGVILGAREGTVFILTNKHVIDGADAGSGASNRLSVTFATGEQARAEVEWLAPEGVDLGVLRAEPRKLPDVRTRLRRDPLYVGDRVFAIGNPLRLSWTYTDGSVSRVHEKRSVGGAAAIEIIQTQTPIQQGNSGGGLYDADGRLVGINTWSADPTEGRGPGFAISFRSVRALVPAGVLELTAGE